MALNEKEEFRWINGLTRFSEARKNDIKNLAHRIEPRNKNAFTYEDVSFILVNVCNAIKGMYTYVHQLEDNLRSLQPQIDALRQKNDSVVARNKDLTERVDRMEVEMRSMKEELIALRAQVQADKTAAKWRNRQMEQNLAAALTMLVHMTGMNMLTIIKYCLKHTIVGYRHLKELSALWPTADLVNVVQNYIGNVNRYYAEGGDINVGRGDVHIGNYNE